MTINWDPVFIEDKLIDLEDRSRRTSLRVDGIKERPNETGKTRHWRGSSNLTGTQNEERQ